MWLGVLAIVSVLEGLGVLALCVGGFLFFRSVTRLLGGIEERQVAPMTARANAILDDIGSVTSLAKDEAEHVARLVRWATGSWRRHRRDRRESA